MTSVGLPVAVETAVAIPAQSTASRNTGSHGLCQTIGNDATTQTKKTTPTHVGTLSHTAPWGTRVAPLSPKSPINCLDEELRMRNRLTYVYG